jgi:hypothetical protein
MSIQSQRVLLALALAAGLVGCGGSSGAAAGGAGGGAASSSAGQGGAGEGGAGGGMGAACEPTFSPEVVRLASGTKLAPGEEKTMCLRWTTPEDIDITSFQGTLGPAAGHHALLLAFANPSPAEPDGLAPCSEAAFMDAQSGASFQMLAGVSYESDGEKVSFPSSPVQIGLSVPAGTQLVFDAHFLNPSLDEAFGCASIDLFRGKPVVAKLEFRTVLPVEQYGLSVPAHGAIDVMYEEPAGGAFRVAAASSHMHAGGTHFRMSIQPSDETLYETTVWAEPKPKTFEATKVLLKETDMLRIECSFENPGSSPQLFPDQMCAGGLYLLSCALPGAC